jgi:hypothetical protein
MQNSGRIDQNVDFSELLSDHFRRRLDVVILADVDFQNVDVRQRRQLRRGVGISTRRNDLKVGPARKNSDELKTETSMKFFQRIKRRIVLKSLFGLTRRSLFNHLTDRDSSLLSSHISGML